MAAVLWFLLNFVYAPSCGRFGCSYEPAWLPQAEADSDDACPDSIDAAADDATWAADQLDTIAEEPQTAGLFYDPDGAVHEFDSSHDADEDQATAALRDLGIVGPNATLTVASHVEVKVAAAMRSGDITKGVLVINRTTGVCSGGKFSCAEVVPQILPEGAQLIVWSPKEIAAGEPLVFSNGG
jgi:hypothetical protein